MWSESENVSLFTISIPTVPQALNGTGENSVGICANTLNSELSSIYAIPGVGSSVPKITF